MSNPGGGGGGVNLPPLNQAINVTVNGANQANSVFNSLTGGAGGAAGGIGGLNAATNGFGYSLLRVAPTWRTFGDSLRMTGSLLKYSVAMPLVNVGRQAIKLSLDFEKSLSLIRGLVGINTEAVNEMGEAILNLAGDVARAPNELADALYFVTSAGITDTAQALEILEAAGKAAAAGLGSVQDVADLTTSIVNAYGEGMYNGAVATDVLVAAVREGKAEANEFAPAMGKVIPVAAAFGVKFQDVAATMAALTRQGAAAGTSAIYLRQVLNSILDPTEKAEKKLREIGLSGQSLRKTIQEEGLLQGLMMLKNGFGDNAEAISQVFGNVRAMTAVFSLLGPNLAENQKVFADLTNNAGDLDTALAEAEKTVGYKLKQASAEAQVSLIRLGDALSPLIRVVAQASRAFAKFSQAFSRNKAAVQFVGTLLAITVGFVALIKTISTFVRLKAMTTTIFMALGSGITDATNGLAKNVITGQVWRAQQFANIGALTGVTGATNAATAATANQAAAQATLANSNIAVTNTFFQNVAGLKMMAGGMSYAAIAGQLLSISLKAIGRTLLFTVGPMAVITLALMGLQKIYSAFRSKDDKNSLRGTMTDLRDLADATSNFKVSPIVIGVDIRYGGGESPGDYASRPDFKEFLYPKDEKGELTEAAQRLQDDVEDAYKLVGEARIDAAAGFLSQFAGDTKTREQAAEYFGEVFGLDKSVIERRLNESLGDPKKYTELLLKRYVGDIDLDKVFKVLQPRKRTDLEPLLPVEAATEAVTKFKALIKQFPDITLIGQDAIASGSALAWEEALTAIYEKTLAATNSTDAASAVTFQYAKSAFEAAGGSAKSSDMLGLLKENAAFLNNEFGVLNNTIIKNADSNEVATMTAGEYLNAVGKLDKVQQKASQSAVDYANDVDSVATAFTDGFNTAVNDAINMMNAYEEALKSVKEGQDALFGSQLDNIDAQVGFRDSLRGAMDALKESSGEIYTNSSAADDSLKSLADLAKSILEVGNAAYANTEGDALTKGAAATAAVTEAYQRALVNLKDAGISAADIEKFFTGTLGKVVEGQKFTFTPEDIAFTFTADDPNQMGMKVLGEDMMSGLKAGMSKYGPEIDKTISKVLGDSIRAARTFIEAASPSKKTQRELGVPMGQGIAVGINSVADEIIAASIGLVDTALNASTGAAKIKSPSALFAQEVGAPIAQGVAAGIISAQSVTATAAKKTITTVYDVLAKGKGGKKINWKTISQAGMQEYAEGILEGKRNVKTSIIQLIDEIMSEIDDQLGKIETSISARLDFAQAKTDLQKFQNEQKGFASQLSKAQRESNQAIAMYGAAPGEVTRYERSKISESAKSAQAAQRDYALGKISYAALVDAQTEYANTQAEATEMSSDVIDAQNSVLDAQFNVTNSSILLAQKQMDVVTAQAALNEAYINAKIAGKGATDTLNGLVNQVGVLGTAASNITTSMAQAFALSPSLAKLVSGAGKQQSAMTISKNKNLKWTKPSTGSGSGRSNVKTDKSELRAAGGPVMSGMPYIVGEVGPELFIPKQGGTIIPTTALERYSTPKSVSSSSVSNKEGNTINFTINNPVPETASDSIARRVQNMSALGLFG